MVLETLFLKDILFTLWKVCYHKSENVGIGHGKVMMIREDKIKKEERGNVVL